MKPGAIGPGNSWDLAEFPRDPLDDPEMTTLIGSHTDQSPEPSVAGYALDLFLRDAEPYEFTTRIFRVATAPDASKRKK